MTNTDEVYVGIDVGKSWLDIAIWGVEEVFRVSNDAVGIAELLSYLEEWKPKLIAVEATGGYEQEAAQAMMLRGYKVAVVNPTRVRALAKALGKLAKTDTIDAHLIAEYAYRIQPHEQILKEEKEMHLRALVTRREQLVEMRSAEKNRLGTTHSSMKADIREHLEWISTQIKILEEEMQLMVDSMPEWQAQMERLITIPGIGFITAITIVVEMPELGQLNRQKIAALAGLAPFNRDSGKKRGKRRIFGGRKGIRRVLYMACLSAIKHNVIIREIYNRLLSKGKLFKVALTACMRKMLTICNAMARDLVDWKPPVPHPA
jgi:transposase